MTTDQRKYRRELLKQKDIDGLIKFWEAERQRNRLPVTEETINALSARQSEALKELIMQGKTLGLNQIELIKLYDYLEVFECKDCTRILSNFYEYIDDHRHLHICEDCFNAEFQKRVKSKDVSWFFNNFNEPAKKYPKLKFLIKHITKKEMIIR